MAIGLYDKSLIFQLFPDIYDQLLHVENSVVLVMSLLNALMHDQIAKLNEQGISACMTQRHCVVSWFTRIENLYQIRYA